MSEIQAQYASGLLADVCFEIDPTPRQPMLPGYFTSMVARGGHYEGVEMGSAIVQRSTAAQYGVATEPEKR